MKEPNGAHRVCSRCVMDTTAGDIEFDDRGVCSYCKEFEAVLRRGGLDSRRAPDPSRLGQLVSEIRRSSRGRDYDCAVGLSGGLDSSWALYQACKLGLRPLAVHMDNGWDTELSQHNIQNLVGKLHVELRTYVVDWEEFRSLQQAFLEADVIDVELLSDNALAGVNYREAARVGVKHILSGSNTATEGLRMPARWSCGNKYDKRNIVGIWRRFGRGRFPRTFPAYGIWDYLADRVLRGIVRVPFLDYLDYNRDAALSVLQRDMSYRPYPYKHYESVFTRFYQGYLLPRKFGVDKRKNHLSALIMTGQMSRERALELLAGSPYPDPELEREDKRYFLSKMSWTEQDLSDYLAREEVPHAAYGSEARLWAAYGSLASAVSGRRAMRRKPDAQ